MTSEFYDFILFSNSKGELVFVSVMDVPVRASITSIFHTLKTVCKVGL